MTIAKIQFRRGTTAQWVAEDPILSLGEPGIELKTDDSVALKIGNGTDSWSELSYYSSEDFVTQAELTTAINGLIDSAPSALNTLNELAAALGDDASFATTITNAIAAKADASHTHTISNITNLQTSLDAKANLAGPTFTGSVVLPATTSIGNVNSTELGYIDGVTSAIQTQLNNKSEAATTETLTNKTINLSNNTVSGTVSQFNTALSDANFITTTDGTITTTGIIGKVTVNSGSTANVGKVFVHNPSGGNPTGAVAGDIWVW